MNDDINTPEVNTTKESPETIRSMLDKMPPNMYKSLPEELRKRCDAVTSEGDDPSLLIEVMVWTVQHRKPHNPTNKEYEDAERIVDEMSSFFDDSIGMLSKLKALPDDEEGIRIKAMFLRIYQGCQKFCIAYNKVM